MSSQLVAFLHVTIQGFMLLSSCSCTLLPSRLLHLKLECVYELPGELVKMQILFQEVLGGT